jgi:hypothetical protein
MDQIKLSDLKLEEIEEFRKPIFKQFLKEMNENSNILVNKFFKAKFFKQKKYKGKIFIFFRILLSRREQGSSSQTLSKA